MQAKKRRPGQEIIFEMGSSMVASEVEQNHRSDVRWPLASLCALLLAAGVFYFWGVDQVPLVEADESFYARVVSSSLASGDPLGFTYDDRPMLDKPPLHLWLMMGSVMFLGEHELALRLPGILLGLLGVALVWAITYRLSRSLPVAVLAGAIFVVSPLAFGFTREVRLDQGVIAAMLAALFAMLVGWQHPGWLRYVLPALAVGFLFKNAAVILAVPAMAAYSIGYRQWRWLRSRELWVGGLWATAIALPWPVLQAVRHGATFWQSFFLQEVWRRTAEGFGNRPSSVGDYLLVLWQLNQPWTVLAVVLLAVLGLLAASPRRIRLAWPRLLAPLVAAVAIIGIITAVKTRIPTYALSSVPLLAIFLAEAVVQLSRLAHQHIRPAIAAAVVIMLLFGAVLSWRVVGQLVNPFHYDQREVGRMLQSSRDPRAPLYLVNWPYDSGIRYYGATDAVSLTLPEASGRVLAAPFYLVLGPMVDPEFGAQGDRPELTDRGLHVLFAGPYLRLFYGTNDLTLPYPQAEP